MAKNKDIIEGTLKEAVAEEVVKGEKGNFLQLQNAAKHFLKEIEILNEKQRYIISRSKLKTQIQELYKQTRENEVYLREVLSRMLTFEEALNDFLGRRIYLTYIYPEGNISFYGDESVRKIYESATPNWGRGNVSPGKMFSTNDLEKEIQKRIQDSIKKRKDVYRVAIERYSEKNKNEEYFHYNPSKDTFYWWAKYHVSLGGWTDPIKTRGEIAEGYADAVINEDSEIMSSKMESSLKNLWLNYIKGKKDSIAALIKGDVVYSKNGDIQFAVKSGQYSTAKIGQYVNFAYNVLQLKELTIEQLMTPGVMNKLIRSGNATEKILEALANNVEEEFLKGLQLKAGQK